jgi:hypothetical protein
MQVLGWVGTRFMKKSSFIISDVMFRFLFDNDNLFGVNDGAGLSDCFWILSPGCREALQY